MLAASEDIEIRRTLFRRMAHARSQTDQAFSLDKTGLSLRAPHPGEAPDHFLSGAPGSVRLEPSSAASAGHKNLRFVARPSFRVRDRSGRWRTALRSARGLARRGANRASTGTGFGQRLTRRSLDLGFSDALLLNVAIEHRLMHAETLAYMLHQLPLDRKRREPQASVPLTGHGAGRDG